MKKFHLTGIQTGDTGVSGLILFTGTIKQCHVWLEENAAAFPQTKFYLEDDICSIYNNEEGRF